MTLKPKLSLSLFLVLFNIILYANCNKDFAWGVATAAFQIEGAWNESGKGPSIWDSFSHIPGRIKKNQVADVADDFYHLYPQDIALMKSLGIKHYRMSIAWSRVLPNGKINLKTGEGINQAGVDFYHRLFDALLEAGIQPWVTLYHWDLPQALDDKTDNGGWLNPDIVHRFNEYAEFCFQTFGSKVKKWLTFNEILQFAVVGYGSVNNAPGRCGNDPLCKEIGGGGDTGREPYLVGHHALIAHGLAVRTYRTKYQKDQGGEIGITNNVEMALPLDPNSQEDIDAAQRYVIWCFCWLYDPIVFGKYPDVMRKMITGNRLPEFNETMSNLIKGSFDFIGFNHYHTHWVKNTGRQGSSHYDDGQYEVHSMNKPYPEGFRLLLNFIKDRYGNHPMYCFENGIDTYEETVEEGVKDTVRVDYMKGYIDHMIKAKEIDGIDIRGYFHWSVIDNFEWGAGFTVRFGLVYVDYENGLKRYPKASGKWYHEWIKNWERSYAEKNLRGLPLEQLISQ